MRWLLLWFLSWKSNHGKIIMVCLKVLWLSFFIFLQFLQRHRCKLKKREYLPRELLKLWRMKYTCWRMCSVFERMICQTLRINNFPLLMIQFDLYFTFQLIRIRVDFRNWTSETQNPVSSGGSPWVSDPQNPSACRDKGGEKKETGSVAWHGGGREEGRVWHRSAFQLHCLPSCACDRGGSENLRFAPQQRQGEECSWRD